MSAEIQNDRAELWWKLFSGNRAEFLCQSSAAGLNCWHQRSYSPSVTQSHLHTRWTLRWRQGVSSKYIFICVELNCSSECWTAHTSLISWTVHWQRRVRQQLCTTSICQSQHETEAATYFTILYNWHISERNGYWPRNKRLLIGLWKPEWSECDWQTGLAYVQKHSFI